MRRERRVNELIIVFAGGSVSIYVFHLISLLAVFNRSSRLLVRPIAIIRRGQRPLFGVANSRYLVRPIAVIRYGQ